MTETFNVKSNEGEHFEAMLVEVFVQFLAKEPKCSQILLGNLRLRLLQIPPPRPHFPTPMYATPFLGIYPPIDDLSNSYELEYAGRIDHCYQCQERATIPNTA